MIRIRRRACFRRARVSAIFKSQLWFFDHFSFHLWIVWQHLKEFKNLNCQITRKWIRHAFLCPPGAQRRHRRTSVEEDLIGRFNVGERQLKERRNFRSPDHKQDTHFMLKFEVITQAISQTKGVFSSQRGSSKLRFITSFTRRRRRQTTTSSLGWPMSTLRSSQTPVARLSSSLVSEIWRNCCCQTLFASRMSPNFPSKTFCPIS